MKQTKLILLTLAALTSIAFAKHDYDNRDKYPPRLPRSESFLGIHFDFHAGDGDKEIGKTVTEEMVQEVLDKVKPDYIQIDCKGHPGRSSYPTQVGNQAGGFVKDTLRIFREVTARNGVALYMHYSGVWDSKAVSMHPEWARVDENGNPDNQKTSVFGPYVDKLLIPQLKELSSEYGVDGYWIDGECWAVKRDYSDAALAAFKAETGITEIPKKFGDPYWHEFSDFHREAFRRYVRHYVDTLHEFDPDIQIASNWAFSSLMAEPITINVDYLSGDYPMQNSVNSGRFEARCLRGQGMPWDLMAWGFSTKWPEMNQRSTKTPKQLKREAAVVLACGGGFQAYYPQNRDGSIRLWAMDVMGEVGKFCRARQKVCHRAESVPQIAMLYSNEALYRKPGDLFVPGGHLPPFKGILYALMENQYHVDITMLHHLEGQMDKYPVIVIPEWKYIPQPLKQEFLAYVRDGGNLLIIGTEPTEKFSDPLGITIEQTLDQPRWIEHGGVLAGLKAPWHRVTLSKGTKPIARTFPSDEPIGPSEIPASVRDFGKGKIAGIYINIGERYHNGKTAGLRDFLKAVIEEIFPEPMVEVEGSHYVDVVLNRNHGNLQVNLINTAGPHAHPDVYTFDDFPAVGPLKVTLRLDEKPRRISRYPGDVNVDFTWEDGVAEILVPRLEIHDILVVED